MCSSSEEVRRMAVAALAELPLSDTREVLYEAMGDESWRVRKESLDILFTEELDDEVIEELVGLLRASDNAGLRNSACEALEKLGKKAIPILCRYIEDEDSDVRKFVIDILGNIGSPEPVPLLIKALADRDPNVSSAAAENLGKIGDERAVSDLVRVLDRTNIPLCYTVLESLGRIGYPVPLGPIMSLANEALLKKPVIDCLGAVGDADSIAILIDGLREKARHVRAAAVSSIVRVRDKLTDENSRARVNAALKALAGSPLVTELIASHTDVHTQLTEPMVRILGLIGDPRAAMLLLEGCRDIRQRQSCLDAFRKLGHEGMSTLIEAYSSMDEEHRCYIAYICGELEVRESVGILKEGMADSSHSLRRVSAVAAGNIPDPGLIPDLESLLNDEELHVRVAAADSLARLAKHDTSSVAAIAGTLAASENMEKRRSSAALFAALQDHERLARLIKDENAQVRRAAVFALAELKAANSINHLVLALVDEEPDVRMAAAGALGSLGGELAVQSLLLALKDQNQWVKCAVLRSLGTLRVAEAEPAIVELVNHSEGLVLIAALRTMLEINAEKACWLADLALADPDKEVVKAAIDILSFFDDNWLDKHRERLLFHEHWDVRSLFIKALVEHRGESALPALRKALELEKDELVKRLILETMDGFS